MLYAADARWWSVYGAEVEHDCSSELWTCSERTEFANYVEGVDEPGLCTRPGRVHLGGNSGYQAVNLAYMFGAKRIILLGYDMQLGPNGEKHHYGNHDGGLPNLGADLAEWARRMVALGADLRSRGVDVINASRQTAIKCLERMPLESALSSGLSSGFRGFADQPLTVLCVLRTGGDYTPEYVRKLRDGIAKHLTIQHRFVCLSDVPVPCERIPLEHGWKGWWSKIEMFRSGVITSPTLYLDLDTVVVKNIDAVAKIPYDFAMLNILETEDPVGNSGAMWIAKPFPHVYERFLQNPDYWMDLHLKIARNRYMGDQAFISDSFSEIPYLHHALPGLFKSYKFDNCIEQIPQGCAVVCFGGHPRPHEADGWVKRVWV